MVSIFTKQLTSIGVKFIFLSTGLFFLTSILAFSSLQDNPDAILGDWKTGAGNAIVRIYQIIVPLFRLMDRPPIARKLMPVNHSQQGQFRRCLPPSTPWHVGRFATQSQRTSGLQRTSTTAPWTAFGRKLFITHPHGFGWYMLENLSMCSHRWRKQVLAPYICWLRKVLALLSWLPARSCASARCRCLQVHQPSQSLEPQQRSNTDCALF